MFYGNMPTSLAYSRKTYIYLFAQLKCKMRLQIVRNWNGNMCFLDGRFYNCFNMRTIFNPFSLLEVALGHALATVTHSTLVNLFEKTTEIKFIAKSWNTREKYEWDYVNLSWTSCEEKWRENNRNEVIYRGISLICFNLMIDNDSILIFYI